MSANLSFNSLFFVIALSLQVLFYLGAWLGYALEKKGIKSESSFLSLIIFCVMNYAVVAGLLKFLKGSQSAIWEKKINGFPQPDLKMPLSGPKQVSFLLIPASQYFYHLVLRISIKNVCFK